MSGTRRVWAGEGESGAVVRPGRVGEGEGDWRTAIVQKHVGMSGRAMVKLTSAMMSS